MQHPCTCVGICLSCDQKKDVLGDTEANSSAAELKLWRTALDKNAQQSQSRFRRTLDGIFNRNFTARLAAVSGLTALDCGEARQLEIGLVWTLVARWSVSRGLSWGHLRVPDLPGNVLLQVSLFDSRQWRRPSGGQLGTSMGYTQGIDRSSPEGPVTSASKPVKSSSGSQSQPFSFTDM